MEPTDSTTDLTTFDAVFVYGTLKQGECRARFWPAVPLSVQVAWVRGHLHGRSDYPALTPGDDRVRGELWRFPPEVMPKVLETLDQVEGTNQPGEPDLYVRILTAVTDAQSRSLGRAYTYFYATDPLPDGFRRIEPESHAGDVAWPSPSRP